MLVRYYSDRDQTTTIYEVPDGSKIRTRPLKSVDGEYCEDGITIPWEGETWSYALCFLKGFAARGEYGVKVVSTGKTEGGHSR